jgi:hypothetical protein
MEGKATIVVPLLLSYASPLSLYRFRWVASQLDTLRKCTSTEVRRTLDALPAALEEMGGRPM